MELKEILNRISQPIKPKLNEEEMIKNEESNISEVITNVLLLLTYKFSHKKTNFIPLGFESKEDEENEESNFN